jgi:predicted O-methyltransferase YrrM
MKTKLHRLAIPILAGLCVCGAAAQPATNAPPRASEPPPATRPGPGATDFTARTLPQSDVEKRILAVLDDVNRNQRRGSMSVPEQDGRLLRLLTESLGAQHVVEIGTSVGYSALWFCLALEKTGGRLTTFEIDAGRAARARENFRRAGVEERVTLVLGDAHETVAQLKSPIDVLFLDADKEGYLDYLNRLLPLVRPGGLVIAHNMNARQADPRYVQAITNNPALETVFVNVAGSGIGLTMKKR